MLHFLVDAVVRELESPRKTGASQPRDAHSSVHSFSKEKTSASIERTINVIIIFLKSQHGNGIASDAMK